MVDCDDYQCPPILKNMKCLIHTLGQEEMCFYNGMHLLNIRPKTRNKNRPLKIKIEDSPFNWTNIKFPPTKEDLIEFERNNLDIYIIIFGYDEDRENSFYNFYLDNFKKYRLDPRSYVFVYHEGHFISVFNKVAFYRFLREDYNYIFSTPFLLTL